MIPGTQDPLIHRNQLPPTQAKPEGTIEVRFAKEMVKVCTSIIKYFTNANDLKLPWLISGELDSSILWSFLPKELRGDEFDSRTRQFYAEVKSVKDNLRAYCITNTVLPLVIHWMTDEQYAWFTQTNREIKDHHARATWWLARIREDESVVLWWLQKFETILDMKFIFCQIPASSPRQQQLKVDIRAWFRGKLVLTCDAVYRFLVDHNPLSANGGDFQQYQSLVCMKILLLLYLY
jgi:hypothetical protein